MNSLCPKKRTDSLGPKNFNRQVSEKSFGVFWTDPVRTFSQCKSSEQVGDYNSLLIKVAWRGWLLLHGQEDHWERRESPCILFCASNFVVLERTGVVDRGESYCELSRKCKLLGPRRWRAWVEGNATAIYSSFRTSSTKSAERKVEQNKHRLIGVSFMSKEAIVLESDWKRQLRRAWRDEHDAIWMDESSFKRPKTFARRASVKGKARKIEIQTPDATEADKHNVDKGHFSEVSRSKEAGHRCFYWDIFYS